MNEEVPKLIYADDATERISLLLKLRLPWLFIGLLLGIVTTLFIGQFETLLDKQLELAFFIPLIVYISDAVGTQTETIYVRNLAKKKVSFFKYLRKELVLGMIIGLTCGLLTGSFALIWIQSLQVAFSVGMAMLLSISAATIIGLLIPTILYEEHTDPAVGAGPLKTVIQDFISVMIYLLIASFVIF